MSACRLELSHSRTYVRHVGLVWDDDRGYIRKGRDTSGRFYAHASQLTGEWYVYLAPWACGLAGGLSLGPFDDEGEAMDAADRHVAAQLDSDVPPPG